MKKEVHGLWWRIGERREQHHGTLVIGSDSRARLTLALTNIESALMKDLRKERYTFSVIHGVQSQRGTHYSLCQCQATAFPLLISSVPYTIEIEPLFIFDGFHIPSLENRNLRSMSFSFPLLHTWIGEKVWNVKSHKKWRGATLSFQNRKPKRINASDRLTILISNYGTLSLHRLQAPTIGIGSSIQVLTRRPESFGYFERVQNQLTTFFTFATLQYPSVENVAFKATFFDQTLEGRKFAARASFIRQKSLFARAGFNDQQPFLFTRDEAGSGLANILTRWFEIEPRFRLAAQSYIAAIYAARLLEPQFLALCQGIESYHRHFIEGDYMDAETCSEEIAKPLMAALPCNLNPDFKNAIKAKLRYLHELSLRSRLRSLTREHEEALAPFSDADPNALANEIVELRNQLTHLVSGFSFQEINYQRMYYLSRLLQTLLECCFLKEVGFPREQIVNLAHNKLVSRFRNLARS